METLSQRCGKAFYPATYRVCRYSVRPFSLGHAFLFDRVLLDKMDSAIAGGSVMPTVPELRLAVAICRRTHNSAQRMLNRPMLAWCALRSLPRINVRSFSVGLRQFLAYRNAHYDTPSMWSESTGPGKAQSYEIKMPVLQQIRMTLLAKIGYAFADVMDVPLNRALIDYVSFWELEGRCKIEGDDEVALRDQLQDEQSALNKEMKAFTESLKNKRGTGNG